MQLAADERHAHAPRHGVQLAKRMMAAEARPPKRRELWPLRASMAELPDELQSIQLHEQHLDKLQDSQVWQFARQSHPVKDLNVSACFDMLGDYRLAFV